MSNIIDKIQVSGVTYDLPSGGSGSTTVELTQAEYDALVSGGTVDPNTYYIISDASPADMSNYWTSAQTNSAITQAVSGKVETSAITTSVTSGSTDSEIPTAKAVFDAIPTGGTGGGKTISAGTNISVTTGETADTVSCTLPIFYTVGYESIKSRRAGVNGNDSIAWGNGAYVGEKTNSYTPDDAFAFGKKVNTYNNNEASFGIYNVSNQNTSVSGASGTTLFSVGNGTAENARHNAFEIRQNGDIYCSDGTNDVKLQDTIAATTANTTALGGLKLQQISQADYDALVSGGTVDSSTLYIITNVVS